MCLFVLKDNGRCNRMRQARVTFQPSLHFCTTSLNCRKLKTLFPMQARCALNRIESRRGGRCVGRGEVVKYISLSIFSATRCLFLLGGNGWGIDSGQCHWGCMACRSALNGVEWLRALVAARFELLHAN
jgi:hypothetical protein